MHNAWNHNVDYGLRKRCDALCKRLLKSEIAFAPLPLYVRTEREGLTDEKREKKKIIIIIVQQNNKKRKTLAYLIK